MSPDPTSRARLNELREHVRETLHPTIDHAALREHAGQVNEWVARARGEAMIAFATDVLGIELLPWQRQHLLDTFNEGPADG